jgi:hypothetical protein
VLLWAENRKPKNGDLAITEIDDCTDSVDDGGRHFLAVME